MAEKSEETMGKEPILDIKKKKRKFGWKIFIPTIALLLIIFIFYIFIKALPLFKADNDTNRLLGTLIFIPFFLISFGRVANQIINLYSTGARIRLMSIEYLTATYRRPQEEKPPKEIIQNHRKDICFSVIKLYLYYISLSLILLFLFKNAFIGSLLGFELSTVQFVYLAIFIAYIPRVLQLTDPKLSKRVLLGIFMPLAVFTIPLFIMKPSTMEFIELEEIALLSVTSLFILFA